SSEQAAALKEIGIGYDAAAAAGSGFSTIVSELMSAAASNENVAATVFGNMGTSFAGFQQTVVTGVPAIVEALGKLQAASSTVDDAFQKHLESPQGKFDEFKSKLEDFLADVGRAVMNGPENLRTIGSAASDAASNVVSDFVRQAQVAARNAEPVKIIVKPDYQGFPSPYGAVLSGLEDLQGQNQGGPIGYAGGGKVGGTGASD